jgi:hypothetical protein
MGRGRAKAKQVKVARQLKYSGGGFDVDQLRAEFGVGTDQQDADDHAAYADFASSHSVDDEDEDDDEDDDYDLDEEDDVDDLDEDGLDEDGLDEDGLDEDGLEEVDDLDEDDLDRDLVVEDGLGAGDPAHGTRAVRAAQASG